jgi:pimeloyl-ACP methyl ester carboxylesterase
MLVSLMVLLGLAGCSTPIGADPVPPRTAAAQFNESALTGSKVSSYTALVLHRYNLDQRYRKEPVSALLTLHQQATNDPRRDVLYALAELNYHHAHQLRRSVKPGGPQQAPDYYLASAIYAYLYLLDDQPRLQPPPGPFDRRFRLACDFYNRGLAQGLLAGRGSNAVVRLASGPRTLAPGPVELELVRPNFKWDFAEIEKFLPADDFTVRGMTVRDRHSGLGAPLIVVGRQLEDKRFPRRFPATLFLRVPGDAQAWSAGRLTATLELYSSYEADSVDVAGQRVPLESDLTAPLAWGLNDAHIWKLGSQQFFSAEERIKSDIYFTQPYEPGRVPVVFVHGTLSSPVWWAEMWNTLHADPTLRGRCQFWNFIYNSGNPISHSAASLRAALQAKLQQLDPEGKDPALRRMVLVGHSQGGLLSKLTVTDTGDALWRTVSRRDLDELQVTPEVRAVLRTNFFFTRLPCVERVVFLSTPHRGSYLATDLVRGLARLFMKLPETALAAPSTLLQIRDQVNLPKQVRSAVPSSLDGMSPKNPWLLALADIPPAPGVTAHSIIALKGDAEPPQGGDGVVKYVSAHVPYVESEYIVRSGHSCQGKPATIEEVRRILIEHLAAGAQPH